jgi:DNA adenine methylase
MIGPLPYVGGKRRLAPQIVALLPPHTTYVEPFAGGAQVFFHKAPSRVEVLNDISGDVVNFLRVCREHPPELVRILRYLTPSRALFAQFAEQNPVHLTDIQRAARFLYLQKNAFGGLVRRRTYHYSVTKPPNFSPSRLPSVIAAAADRLRHVQLEQSSYERVLARYDRDTTLFYVDPPYIGLALYEANFSDEDFQQLADRLSHLKGRFLLSINDCEVTRRLVGQFQAITMRIPYTTNRSVPVAHELLLANFAIRT